jgi:N6-adenosine-specific RNA methylase IME4
LIDPPWAYYGDPNKNAAAGKHYSLMTDEEIKALPVKSILEKNAYVFVWATCPKLDLAIEAIKSWGLYYRGIGHIWVKASKAGKIINGQGIPPTYSKPTSELLLVATTKKTGRPVKLLNSAIQQIVVEPRPQGHSTKPTIFYDLIEKALGTSHNRIEIFARSAYTGWDAIGNAVSAGEDINTTLKRMTYDHTKTAPTLNNESLVDDENGSLTGSSCCVADADTSS